MRLFLVGFMGSGKTTTGRKLARHLNYEFYDLDRLIEQQQEQTIPAIFEEVGETAFRRLEQQVLHQLLGHENVVVATGGGTPCFFDNIQKINAAATSIYLQASVHYLHYRLLQAKKPRPLLRNKTSTELLAYIESKLSQRRIFYEQAHLTVDANRLKHARIELLKFFTRPAS